MPPSAFRLNLENVRDIAADLYEEPSPGEAIQRVRHSSQSITQSDPPKN